MKSASNAREIKSIQTWLSSFVPAANATPRLILRAIEVTVDSLQAVEQLMSAVASSGRNLAGEIAGVKPEQGKLMDKDDVLIGSLEDTIRACEHLLTLFVQKKSAIDSDGSLDTENADLLHICYDRALSSIADLVEATKEIRAAVIRHDLAAEGKPAKEFADLDDLISSLHSAA